MPYILQKDREELTDRKAENAGEMNFLITSLCDDYLLRKGRNYANINEVIGALECAKLELYRRIAGPYEDTKIASNTDVFSDQNLTKLEDCKKQKEDPWRSCEGCGYSICSCW